MNLSAKVLCNWRFNYIDVERKGEIRFQDGKASLKIADLPVGKSGDVTLKILENADERLIGESKNVTLTSGANKIELKMRVAGGGNNGDTAELTLDLVFGDGEGETFVACAGPERCLAES